MEQDIYEFADKLTYKRLIILGMNFELGEKIKFSNTSDVYITEDGILECSTSVGAFLIISYILCNCDYQTIDANYIGIKYGSIQHLRKQFVPTIEKLGMQGTTLGKIVFKLLNIPRNDPEYCLTPELFNQWNNYAGGILNSPFTRTKSARKI